MLKIKPILMGKIFLSIVILLSIVAGDVQSQNEKDNNTKSVISEAELQGQIMAFADRYWSVMTSAMVEYLAQSPSPENQRIIRGQMTYSGADAYTIAAGPRPVAAFLDMVVMVTLGRMVFEQHYLKIHGDEIIPLVNGFKKVEADIWEIAHNLLTQEQQDKLMGLIEAWRRDHPGVVVFSRVRFSEFEKFRTLSDESGKASAGGLFKSVTKVTEQVEEARMLAERGMYLGSRLPLLTGALASTWMSSLLAYNADVSRVMSDLHRISDVSERLAVVAENLPEDVSKERQATIDQLVDRISVERKNTIKQLVQELARERKRTIEEFLAEEDRMHGLLTDLKLTLVSGNELLISTNDLLERLDVGRPEADGAAPSSPFDIKDYQATLKEASTTILQIQDLLKTVDQMDLEKVIPLITEASEQLESKGEKWVLQAFVLGVILILILLIGAVFSMLLYRYMMQRMFDPQKPPAAS